MKQKLRVFALNRKLYDIKKDNLRGEGSWVQQCQNYGNPAGQVRQSSVERNFRCPFPVNVRAVGSPWNRIGGPVHIAAMPLMAVALKVGRRLQSATTASSRRSARAKERREKAKANGKQ
jgi:hypothetical protein